MAYLHCHNCGWSQDDFWDEEYNPITWLQKHMKDELLHKDLDEIFEIQKETLTGKIYMSKMTRREFIANQLERAAQRIREMIYRTEEEYERKNPLHICPNCGKPALDID